MLTPESEGRAEKLLKRKASQLTGIGDGGDV